ncbi:DUF5672 family protein [Sphingobium sp. DN12]|uniref:DUF5672 family protein n=1 Tax=Sphingobium sp. DN12 TaxID=3378073 RepID=UPI003DA30B05
MNITSRLPLPQVTLCAVSSVNVAATVQALETSLAQVDVAAALLLTDSPVQVDHPGITVVPIAPITSSRAYSDFILTQLADHIDTSHCLITQWDGHVLDASRWQAEFLDHDYVGASWPQFTDGHDVGNGGFSLRSRRLMRLCRDSAFQPSHPEDVAIARINRNWLEAQGMRFASRALADRFAAERAGDVKTSFGYHGAWLMPQALGVEPFWNLYRELDDRGTIRHDFASILKQIGRGRGGWIRALRLMLDQFRR